LETDFRHTKFINKGKVLPFIGTWLSIESIQQKIKFGNYPFKEKCPEDEYNVWEEFACKTWERDEYERDEGAIEIFTDHLKSLCNFEENVYDFMLKWVAHMFQKTDIKPGVCPIISGKQGTGKDLFLDVIAEMMGAKKRFESTQPEVDVYGEFNPLLMGAFVIQLSEINKRNTMNHLGKIKSLITSPTVKINDKGKTHVTIPSLHRPAVISNNTEPITGEKGQRRFIHFYGADTHIGDGEYFKKVVALIEDKNALLSIYDYLMEVENVPDKFTNIDQYFSIYQKNLNENNEPYEYQFMKNFVNEMLKEGKKTTEVKGSQLFRFYKTFLEHEELNCFISNTKFGTKITAMMISASITKIRKSGGMFYILDNEKLMVELKIKDDTEIFYLYGNLSETPKGSGDSLQ
jgi:hypothetical protein